MLPQGSGFRAQGCRVSVQGVCNVPWLRCAHERVASVEGRLALFRSFRGQAPSCLLDTFDLLSFCHTHYAPSPLPSPALSLRPSLHLSPFLPYPLIPIPLQLGDFVQRNHDKKNRVAPMDSPDGASKHAHAARNSTGMDHDSDRQQQQQQPQNHHHHKGKPSASHDRVGEQGNGHTGHARPSASSAAHRHTPHPHTSDHRTPHSHLAQAPHRKAGDHWTNHLPQAKAAHARKVE